LFGRLGPPPRSNLTGAGLLGRSCGTLKATSVPKAAGAVTRLLAASRKWFANRDLDVLSAHWFPIL